MFAIEGVANFEDTFVQSGITVLRMKFGAKIPGHRPPPTWAEQKTEEHDSPAPHGYW